MILEAQQKYSKAIEFLNQDSQLTAKAIQGTELKHLLDNFLKASGNYNLVIARAICDLEIE